MGGDWHLWAEAQEVTFVGLLILSRVGDGTHTAHRKQRLMRNQKFRLGTSFLADPSTAHATTKSLVPCVDLFFKTFKIEEHF